MSKRIAFLHPMLIIGGAEQMLTDMSNALEEEGGDV